MKNTLIIISAVLFLFACQPSSSDSNPSDLAGKKQLLKDKIAEQKILEQSILSLKKEIEKLDPPKEKAPVLVSAVAVRKSEFSRHTDVQAVVISDDLVSASSEMGGRITKLHVKENQYVKRGQLIASVDAVTIDKQTAEIEKSLELAQMVYDRQKRLWDQNIGSEIQYLEAKNNKERIEKSLETIASQRAKANVYAPISGVVDMEFLKQGEMASPGMPIVNILNTSTVKFVADVPESYLGKIKKGQMVDIYIPALDKEYQKRVSQLGRSIDPANRTFKIEIESSNGSGTLKPNLLAEVKFEDLNIKDAILLPVNLIQEEVGGKKYVYTSVVKDGKKWAQKTYIETSETNGEEIVITSGIGEGDQVITEGSNSVSNMTLISLEKLESEDE